MKRISILVYILGMYFVCTAWAQQVATKPLFERHLQHRIANQTSNTPGVTANQSLHAQLKSGEEKIWELGTYPGGTWFASMHLNDFGVIVGRGDVPPIDSDGVGYTHTLAVPLFGPHAGEWTDLETLGGEQPKWWEEPLTDISNTGLVVGSSVNPDGLTHAVAWTKPNEPIDLGTLADTGDPKYATYTSSYAYATNRLGTLIVGVGFSQEERKKLPTVWTPSFRWKNGKFVTQWNVEALDLSAFSGLTRGVAWGVNNSGQIIGTCFNNDLTVMIALVWSPRHDGKGWNPMSLPLSPGLPMSQAYGINDRGEVVGVANSADQSVWLPRVWQPLDRKRTTYSQPIELPVPEGFNYCENVGINNPGDMVGDCWDEAYTMDLPTRWSTRDLAFSEIMNFPADWGFAEGVNDNRIAVITYTGGQKCTAGIPWVYTCGGAIQLH